LPRGRYDGTEMFRVVLKDPTGGATFVDSTDGGGDTAILSIILTVDCENRTRIDKLLSIASVNWDQVEVGNKNWKEQFTRAIYCLGSREDQAEAVASDWVAHIIALPWKVLFACVPPTAFAGGWMCFFCALVMIGLVTMVIGDLAELFGCCLGIRPELTAITFVACGTSLPDTFASRAAAQMDPHADNSIGNVTGSNSVNVFLGLGLPWMVAALYWTYLADCVPDDKWSLQFPEVAQWYPTGAFVVKAGSLTVFVTTFCICASLCLTLLALRRVFLGGELGGPTGLAYGSAAFLCGLWIVFLAVSILFGFN